MSNDYRAYVECDYNSIYHHGVKGQKWGIRRYQNEDGSLTPQGMARYKKYRDAYMQAGYSKKEASELAKRKTVEHYKRKDRSATAAAIGASAYGAYDTFNRARNMHHALKSAKRGTSKTSKAANKVKKGLGFTEKYVKGHAVDADGVLNPIMKTRLTKKGKIGLAVAGAAALGAGGYALYRHHKKKKQQQNQKRR